MFFTLHCQTPQLHLRVWRVLVGLVLLGQVLVGRLVFSPLFAVLEAQMLDANVLLQVARVGEGRVADLAAVLLDLEVSDPHVGVEVGFLCKLGAACLARVDLPVLQAGGVGGKMLLQPLLGVERVAALTAHERLLLILMHLKNNLLYGNGQAFL